MNHNTPCTSCIDEYYKLKRKLCEDLDKDKRYTQEKKIKKDKVKRKPIITHSVETKYLKYVRLFEKGYSAVEVADITKDMLSYIRNCQTLWRKQLNII